ncbi:hypothetical protein ACGFSB_25195 [Streptomyces sp. NPDC048441]
MRATRHDYEHAHAPAPAPAPAPDQDTLLLDTAAKDKLGRACQLWLI